MRAHSSLVAALALVLTGCAMDAGEPESVQSAQQALPAREGNSFTQQIRHAWPWEKQTHICELSVLVDAVSPIEFQFSESAGEVVTFISVLWTGDPVRVSIPPGKDRAEVQGDCAELPCRVTATITTKGNPPATELGCEISARLVDLDGGFAPVEPFITGNADRASLAVAMPGSPEEAMLFRERVAHDEEAAAMRHACTLRHIFGSGAGIPPVLVSQGHTVYQNAAPLPSPAVPVPLGTVSWPTNVLDLGVVAPFPFPGRYLVGQDLTSERIKSHIPFNGPLAPSDVMACEDALMDDNGRTTAELRRPGIEQGLGIWLRPGDGPQP